MAKTWLKVTRQDIKDAILVADILGGYAEAFPDGDAYYDLCCLVNSEHCPTCTCKSEECRHSYIWECLGEALEASLKVDALYVRISNAIDDLFPHRARERETSDPETRAWIASLVDETSRFDRGLLRPDLETAALLRDGLLPPGVILVKPRRTTRKRRS